MFHNKELSSLKENSTVKFILVVEDDADIGEFLVLALSQETPYYILLLQEGLQALNVVESVKPDLFILDYRLPIMNGIELYDRLHTRKGLGEVPTIIMSAAPLYSELGDRKVTVVEKPLELDNFLHTIATLLTNHDLL